MGKIFYISLMVMLTATMQQGFTFFRFYQFYQKQTASSLLTDFGILELAFIICSSIVSAIFFIYRFNEKVIWPIASTLFQLIYIYFVWSEVFQYYSNPVGFIQEKMSIWNRLPHNISQSISNQYKCCGFDENDRPKYCRSSDITCSRAIIKKIGRDLFFYLSNDMTMSFIHVASMIAIWMTYFLGGIEYDQVPENRQGEVYQSLEQ